MRSPSLCKQSELQCFASDLRRMFAQHLLANLDFLDFEHPLIPSKNCEFPTGSHTKSPAALLDETRNAAGLIVCLPPSAAAVLAGQKEQRDYYVLLWPQGVAADEAISRFSAVYQNFTVPRLRSTSMPSWALRLNLPAFLALNLMVKSSWLPSSRRKLLPRLTKVG